MKKILLISLCIIISSGVFAKGKIADSDSDDKLCEKVGLIAYYIMYSRQNDDDLSKTLKDYDVNRKDSTKFSKIEKELILLAYEQPKYETHELKKSKSKQFENTAMINCIRTLQKVK